MNFVPIVCMWLVDEGTCVRYSVFSALDFIEQPFSVESKNVHSYSQQ